MMKKYIVFSWNQYYPNGGLDDISDSFDTLSEATKHIRDKIEKGEYSDFFEVVNRDTWEKIKGLLECSII